MLWVYLNKSGAAECVVNVGNKIRQGDAFELFVVPWGLNNDSQGEDISNYQVSSVRYLAPPNLEFKQASEGTPEETIRTFNITKTTQANYHFMSGTPYKGFYVKIPSEATSGAVNGGNIALEIVLFGDNGFSHGETITVYVEPTYGAKRTMISDSDYNLIIDLIRQANFILSFGMMVADENGAEAIPDDDSAYPTLYLSKSLGFVHGSLKIDRAAITDAYNALPEEEADGFATIAYLDTPNVTLKIPATFFGRDRDGNDVQFRLNNGTGHCINLDVYISDVQDDSGTASDIDVVTFFGTCWVVANYLEWGRAEEAPAKVITDVQAVTETLPAGSDATVGITIIDDEPESPSSTLRFSFGIPQGGKGEDGVDGESATMNATATSSTTTLEPSENANVSITLSPSGTPQNRTYNFGFDFRIPKGENGVLVETQGFVGFMVVDGHLVAKTVGEEAPDICIVSDDPNSDYYYETLGLPASMVGHLIYTY